MVHVIERLHEDHKNIGKLLDFLDAQIDRAAQGEQPDFELMFDVMHYMTTYPDIYHHPFEDRIFEKLGRHEEWRPLTEEAHAEHEYLTQRGQRFLDVIQTVLSEVMLERDVFVAKAREYVQRQREHLDREEGALFPAARALLTEAEWATIDRSFETMPDPLFGRMVKGEYQRIANELDIQLPDK